VSFGTGRPTPRHHAPPQPSPLPQLWVTVYGARGSDLQRLKDYIEGALGSRVAEVSEALYSEGNYLECEPLTLDFLDLFLSGRLDTPDLVQRCLALNGHLITTGPGTKAMVGVKAGRVQGEPVACPAPGVVGAKVVASPNGATAVVDKSKPIAPGWLVLLLDRHM
jgi:hypothetical protein